MSEDKKDEERLNLNEVMPEKDESHPTPKEKADSEKENKPING